LEELESLFNNFIFYLLIFPPAMKWNVSYFLKKKALFGFRT
jgi:hypothetical protein